MLTFIIKAKHEKKNLDRATRVDAKSAKEAIEFGIAYMAKVTKTRKNDWIAHSIEHKSV